MSKHLLQIRNQAKADTRDGWYSPQRDMAYLGPNIMAGAIVSLDERYHEEWFRKFLVQAGVAPIDLGQAAVAMSQAMMKIVDATDPPTALAETGFTKLPAAAQAAKAACPAGVSS